MRFKKIIRMFEDGNVCVTGLRGRGKDMLMSNVVVRRKKPYVSNVDYKGKKARFKRFYPLDYDTKKWYGSLSFYIAKAMQTHQINGTGDWIESVKSGMSGDRRVRKQNMVIESSK
jgi:hypothetical protein